MLVCKSKITVYGTNLGKIGNLLALVNKPYEDQQYK